MQRAAARNPGKTGLGMRKRGTSLTRQRERRYSPRMTADEIHELEQQMDVLARQYAATHDPKILAELKALADRLGELKNKTNATSPKILH